MGYFSKIPTGFDVVTAKESLSVQSEPNMTYNV
jgi:hypothetical protein